MFDKLVFPLYNLDFLLDESAIEWVLEEVGQKATEVVGVELIVEVEGQDKDTGDMN